MKRYILLSLLILSVAPAMAQQGEKNKPPTAVSKPLIVDAACGQCKLGLPGKGCNLAVRIDSVAYFVDGSEIDSHGDAHAADGFCKAIRKAKVEGKVVEGRFKATAFNLLPEPAKKD